MPMPTSETAAIRQVVRALVADGYALIEVDGEPVKGERAAMAEITATGDAHLYVKSGATGEVGWVYFIIQGGQDPAPDEVVCDYTTNLSETLDPLYERWYA